MLSTNYLYVNYITCVPLLGGEFTSMTIQAWSINLRTLFPNLSGIVRIANRYFVEVIKKCITNVKSNLLQNNLFQIELIDLLSRCLLLPEDDLVASLMNNKV